MKQVIICLCKSCSNLFLEPTSTKQWRVVSCSRKQRGPLTRLELTTDRYPLITSQTCYPVSKTDNRALHAAIILANAHINVLKTSFSNASKWLVCDYFYMHVDPVSNWNVDKQNNENRYLFSMTLGFSLKHIVDQKFLNFLATCEQSKPSSP